jgi:hypothetical protein
MAAQPGQRTQDEPQDEPQDVAHVAQLASDAPAMRERPRATPSERTQAQAQDVASERPAPTTTR